MGVFFVGGLLFVCFNFALASFVTRLIRAHRPHYAKNLTYECGEAPQSEAWVQYNARYYLFAMMFVLFDVEAAFLLPWAVGFQSMWVELGWLALIEMVIFLGILGLGLVYAWRKGALEWV
ncbi:MAG: NADH-quinone oxidoreductase subunit A [Vulcanimicrobiota bacterium]